MKIKKYVVFVGIVLLTALLIVTLFEYSPKSPDDLPEPAVLAEYTDEEATEALQDYSKSLIIEKYGDYDDEKSLSDVTWRLDDTVSMQIKFDLLGMVKEVKILRE